MLTVAFYAFACVAIGASLSLWLVRIAVTGGPVFETALFLAIGAVMGAAFASMLAVGGSS